MIAHRRRTVQKGSGCNSGQLAGTRARLKEKQEHDRRGERVRRITDRNDDSFGWHSTAEIARELPDDEAEGYGRGRLPRRQREQHWNDHKLNGRREPASDFELDARGQRDASDEH